MTDGEHRLCQVCESEITPEQIAKREAGLLKGVLHCPKCVQAKRQAATQTVSTAPVGATASGAAPARPATAEEPITLLGSDEGATQSSMIRSFPGGGGGAVGEKVDRQFKRPLAGKNDGATRCRTFHAKLAAGAIVYLDDQINEWIDGHPEVFIKTVSTTVGLFEGKHAEPHLLITIFY